MAREVDVSVSVLSEDSFTLICAQADVFTYHSPAVGKIAADKQKASKK